MEQCEIEDVNEAVPESSPASPSRQAKFASVSLDRGTDHELLKVQGKINGRPATMLIDSGSTHDFLADQFVKKNNIRTKSCPESLTVTLADGSASTRTWETTDSLKVIVSDFRDEQEFTVFPLTHYDAILGKPWLTRNNPSINFRTNDVQLGTTKFTARDGNQASHKAPSQPESLLISGRQARHALRQGAQGFIAIVTSAQEPQEGKREMNRDIQALLKEFTDVFPEELPDRLPPERTVNHEIDLEPGGTPPSRPAFRLPKPHLDELKTQIDGLLQKGLIEPSKSPYGAPVFFVKKADGSLRMVCDWRQLNKITIKNKACLPNIEDLFDTVQGSCYFTKLDLRSGYHQVRIRPDDIPKTAINTPLGHFQFTVMGFGLTNAPATFQSLMNSILLPHLRKFVVVFLDDILIFSKSLSAHLDHIRTVLSSLRENQLYCKLSKCEFGAEEVLFLGHRIDGHSIMPDDKKLSAVKAWPTPTSVTEVRQFLGFTNYFRRFINHYSSIASPLEEITGKGARFVWNSTRQKAFLDLKSALVSAPVLKIADTENPFRVISDASDFAIAAVLLQQGNNSLVWHPAAYCSRKLTPAERNYTASERETLGVVFALQTWRIYLFQHFDVYVDNRAVLYLKTKPHLTKREARWAEFLADFHYTVHHKPGLENMADPLSRRPDLHEPELDAQSQNEAIINAIEYALELRPDISNLISHAYERDKELSPIVARVKQQNNDNIHERYVWDREAGHLYLRATPSNRLCVPQCELRLKLLQEYHECPTAGHPGRDRTYFRLARWFYWPRMGIDVKKFVKSCSICQRTKGAQQRSGLLQSLPVPSSPWKDISMDFITGLPKTKLGHDSIYVFVDRLTKGVHLVPTDVTIDAKGSADLYIQNVFRLHGLSSTIVSDRDPRFTATFFEEIFDQLGTKLCFSTANHPQTDGQTERVNRQIEDVLRAFVNHKQDNWDKLLPLCEFAINSSRNSSVGNSPFFLMYGQDPKSPPDIIARGGERSAAWLQEQQDAIKIARDSMVAAQARQAVYADRGRATSKLKVGDLVLVYRDFLVTPEARRQPSRKLQQKWFGPFPIVREIGPNALELELPPELKCHPVFNVTALKRFHVNDIPGRQQPPPPPLTDLDGHTRYMVEAVLDERRLNGRHQYLVHWQGYPADEATWEPTGNLLDESGLPIAQLKSFLRKPCPRKKK